MPFVEVLNENDITQITQIAQIITINDPVLEDQSESEFAQQLAQVSQTILETKVNIGRSAYPTGLNLLKSPRFWVNLFAIATTAASMVTFNSSVSKVTKDGDVIFTDWIPFEYKQWLFLLSATMATNLPLNLKQAVEITFAEFERLYGDLHLWGPFKFKDAIQKMQSVKKNEFPNKKRYAAAVTWALASAGAFAGMGLMGGMSDLLTIPVMLSFGFLHMSVMTALFLPKPESLLKNLTQGERVAQLLQKAYVARLNEAVKHLPEGFFDSSPSAKSTSNSLYELMENIQSNYSATDSRNSSAIQFELHLLNFLKQNNYSANITHPSMLNKASNHFKKPANYTRVFAVTLAGYLYATMVFFIWLLQKIHKTTDENTIRAYNDTGYVLGLLAFVPFIGFVLQVLPSQASNLYQLIRHPQQSFRERSLAARQGLWMPILLIFQAICYLLVFPSTGSLNYLNDQFLNAAFDFNPTTASENPPALFNILSLFLVLTAYPMTTIFNSLGIGPATANIANTLIAIPGGRAGTMQKQQRVLEYAERLAKFEDQQTPAAFLAHLHDIKQKLTPDEFEQFCQAKFNLEDVKEYVASIDKPTSDHEAQALLANRLPDTIKNAESYSALIDACFANMREAGQRVEGANAAANVGFFGGRNYTGLQQPNPDADSNCCPNWPLVEICLDGIGSWCQQTC